MMMKIYYDINDSDDDSDGDSDDKAMQCHQHHHHHYYEDPLIGGRKLPNER